MNPDIAERFNGSEVGDKTSCFVGATSSAVFDGRLCVFTPVLFPSQANLASGRCLSRDHLPAMAPAFHRETQPSLAAQSLLGDCAANFISRLGMLPGMEAALLGGGKQNATSMGVLDNSVADEARTTE